MDSAYRAARQRAELAMAERAADPRARRVHLELASRYADAVTPRDGSASPG